MKSAITRWEFALAVGSLLMYLPAAHAAGGVVGTGTPASCTEASFNAVFFNAQSTGGGTISFNCGAAPHVIVVTVFKPVSANTTLRGGGLITLNGGDKSSLFQVNTSLTLDDITLTGARGAYGAIENFGRLNVQGGRLVSNVATVSGGAILNHGDMSATNVVFSGNSASQSGGAVHTDGGSATVDGSQFADNTAVAGGGAIALTLGASLTITASELSGNKVSGVIANADGGAIHSAGTLAIFDSTLRQNGVTSKQFGGGVHVTSGSARFERTVISNNVAGAGGGIHQRGGVLSLTDVTLAGNGYSSDGVPIAYYGGGLSAGGGTVDLRNVTISNNWAKLGGGVGNGGGTTTLTNVTIGGNRATDGGAIAHDGGRMTLVNVTVGGNSAPFPAAAIATTAPTMISLKNTLLANDDSRNCNVPIAAASFSFSSDSSCNFGSGRDSVLLEFERGGNNGGFTFTALPRPNNPGINNGTGVGCPSTDQRGVARPVGLACDAGAVEYVPGAPAVATAVEYFHAQFGHYFMANLEIEITNLDAGVFAGWKRTGQRFNVYSPLQQLLQATDVLEKASTANRAQVCRFFTVAFLPSSSHFYAPRGLGCEGTLTNPDWQYEGDVFLAPLPNANGECAAGDVPVYRLYNNGQGGAPNHRFTTSPSIRQQMLAQGYIAEGAGIGVGMCSPL